MEVQSIQVNIKTILNVKIKIKDVRMALYIDRHYHYTFLYNEEKLFPVLLNVKKYLLVVFWFAGHF